MIYIAADHRGFSLKETLVQKLEEVGIEFEDLGADELNEGDDYPDYAKKLVESMNPDSEDRGIIICGSGVGADIAVNRHSGFRAGLGINKNQVEDFREDDDVNVLALAADYTSKKEAWEMVESFLTTDFAEKPRYIRRLKKIEKYGN